MPTTPSEYDANGPTGTHYEYDRDRRLTAIELPSGQWLNT